MIKFLDVRDLGDSKFLVSVLNEGKTEKFTVISRRIFIEEMNKEMPFLNSDNKRFYEVCGQTLTFRKKLSEAIQKLEARQPELQAA